MAVKPLFANHTDHPHSAEIPTVTMAQHFLNVLKASRCLGSDLVVQSNNPFGHVFRPII